MMARSDGKVGLIVSRRVKEEGCHRAIEEDLQAFVVPVPVPGCEGIISLEARGLPQSACSGVLPSLFWTVAAEWCAARYVFNV